MDRLATAIRYDPDAQKNVDLVDVTDVIGRGDNAAFLGHVAQELLDLSRGPEGGWFEAGGAACIGLIGQYGLAGSAIRHAQSIIRIDRSPSNWSHCFLFRGDLTPDPVLLRGRRSPWLWESTFDPVSPFNHFIERVGVGARRVADYAYARFQLFQPQCVPNFAVIAIGLTPDERRAVLKRASDPNVDQLTYDLGGLLGTWYSYVTDTATRPNPLASGHSLYCSAYVQLAYDAAGIDLAPGAQLRNTSPEHLWQMAKYLSSGFRVGGTRGEMVARPVRGWYCLRELTGVAAPLDRNKDAFPRNLERAVALIEARGARAVKA
jgi:hypothetical protein